MRYRKVLINDSAGEEKEKQNSQFPVWYSGLELYTPEGPTVEKIGKDDLEILVAGQRVGEVRCTCAREAEDL